MGRNHTRIPKFIVADEVEVVTEMKYLGHLCRLFDERIMNELYVNWIKGYQENMDNTL